jgi:alanine racemase
MRPIEELNTWIEISADAYRHNLAFFRRLVGDDVELSAVVKANAYGHGMEEIARLACSTGVAKRGGAGSFCVHSLDEAFALRDAGFREDVLVMGHVPLARLDEVVAADVSVVLYNHESLAVLADVATSYRPARVHLKIETGTHRQGVDARDLASFLDFLKDHPDVWLEGVCTHFANIEDTTDHSYANHQLERFEKAVEQIRAAGFEDVRRHAACSAAALVVPRTHFDMVRLGISQYGIWPSKETYLSYKLQVPEEDQDVLCPVLTWKTRISQVKEVPAGASVGYGCSYQTTRATRVAILPIGYSDGYDRRLSNQAHVLVRGRRAPVRGRVCMNLTMIDVTDIPGAALEDEVVVLGRQGEQEVTAEHLAGLVGTIAYEVVARIRPALPRRVV